MRYTPIKTLLIGGSSGMGQEIAQLPNPYNVTITNRAELDINDAKSRDQFKSNYTDYDLIILNAYGEFTSQINILSDITEQIEDNRKDTFELRLFQPITDETFAEFERELNVVKEVIMELKLNSRIFK